MTNPNKKVLLLGFDVPPGAPITQDTLLKILDGEQQRCEAAGYDMNYFLVDPLNPNIADMKSRIRDHSWDVVSIGYGVRGSQEGTGLFETMVNSVIEEAEPVPKFAFNLMPNQVVEAVQRVMSTEGSTGLTKVHEGQINMIR